MKELNQISKDCATELEIELGLAWLKPATQEQEAYCLPLFRAPPTRLLALELALAYWLDWVMQEKHADERLPFSPQKCWERIRQAYEAGVRRSVEQRTPSA